MPVISYLRRIFGTANIGWGGEDCVFQCRCFKFGTFQAKVPRSKPASKKAKPGKMLTSTSGSEMSNTGKQGSRASTRKSSSESNNTPVARRTRRNSQATKTAERRVLGSVSGVVVFVVGLVLIHALKPHCVARQIYKLFY